MYRTFHRAMRTLSLSLALMCASACEGETDPGVDAGGALADAGGSADGGGTPFDTGAPQDGGALGDGGAATDGGGGGDGYTGTVSLTHGILAGDDLTILGGFFTESADIRLGVLPGCTEVRRVGPCVQATCSSLDPSLSAGTLTASVSGAAVVTSMHSAGGYFATVAGRTFAAGDTVTLAVTGADVPAFTSDVVAPAVLATSLPLTYAPGADLTFTWGPTDADEVEVGISSASIAVICAVRASEGTLTIAGAITADFAGELNTNIKAINITRVDVATHRIAVIAADVVGATMTAR